MTNEMRESYIHDLMSAQSDEEHEWEVEPDTEELY